MNRRTFLHRAALALGGALLAPLVGVAKRTEAAPAPSIHAAHIADCGECDWATSHTKFTTGDEFIPDDWSDHILAGYEPVGWVKAFDPADIERAFAEPVVPWDFPSDEEDGGFDTTYTPLTWNHTTATEGVTVETWTYTGWREAGD